MEIKKYRRMIDAPWHGTYKGMRQRCNYKKHPDYQYYGGRGIKANITFEEVGMLYYKYHADKMKRPSIDRIDNDGDYVLNNCKFIEQSENTIKSNLGRVVSEESRQKRREAMTGRKIVKK